MHAAQHDAVNGARAAVRDLRLDAPRSRRRRRGRSRRCRAPRCSSRSSRQTRRRSTSGSRSRSQPSLTVDAEDAGVALGRAVGDAVLAGARGRWVRHAGSVRPHAWARSVGTNPTGVRADARTAVPERDAVHAARPRRSSCRTRRPRSRAGRYARDYNEVKLIGQDISPARTADQTHIAHFWAEPSASEAGAGSGTWCRRATATTCTAPRACRRCSTWRWPTGSSSAGTRSVTSRSGGRSPRSATGDTDANARTAPDPSWMSLRPTPALPDYPSTHSLLGGAAAEVLRRVHRDERLPVLHGRRRPRHPPGRSGAGIRSRGPSWRTPSRACWSGFHFRFAIETGIEVGRQVGRFAMRHALRQLRNPTPPPRLFYVPREDRRISPARRVPHAIRRRTMRSRKGSREADASTWPAVHPDDWGGRTRAEGPAPWVPAPSLPCRSRSRDAG